ncbi:repressor LexA [Microcoleus sp. FACHB-1515]|uniref:transcriptional repressor LexA n=1 Tax=Cyanophyceae TaxID=3028117 RepID=UPI001687EFBD|nr:transcriptional repressor LexA [Microcoleus sp. FACHB-1515]MBD2091267.1 repressor LexA [Microcoleus sp. FACHB-1515]
MQPLTKPQQQLYDWLVAYMHEHEPTPSIREMMEAMGLRSTSAIQSRLQYLHDKGYIIWNKESEGKSRRTRIHICQPEKAARPAERSGLPILGTIAAGYLVEPFTDEVEQLDLPQLFQQPECFVLQVGGDSMIDDHILPGDFAILRRVSEPHQIRNGTIVAAQVRGETTLKRFYREGSSIWLKPANPAYEPIAVNPKDLEIQGVLIGVWRPLAGSSMGR